MREALTSAAVLLPLGLDTFLIAAVAGLHPMSRAQRVRLGSLLALLEGGAPAVGLVLGRPLSDQLAAVAGVAAGGVLVLLGVLALRSDEDEQEAASRLVGARGFALVAVALSTSTDELALGFSLGLLGLPVVPVLVALGLQALVLSQLGFALGSHLPQRLAVQAERTGGALLILLGVALMGQQLR